MDFVTLSTQNLFSDAKLAEDVDEDFVAGDFTDDGAEGVEAFVQQCR